MPLPDLFIPLREILLDLVSGSDRTRNLNPSALLKASPVIAHEANPMDEDPTDELSKLPHEVLLSGLADHGEKVDYTALRASPLYHRFRFCMGNLRAFDPSALTDRNARLAFWINLYNTLVLDAVIVLGVRHSVMERRAGITFFRQAAYVVGGQRMSCDDIEHGILRANRGHPFYPGRQFSSADPRLKWVIEPPDVRVHFALNCASRSCPPIRTYSPEKLDSQLDLATRSFLATDIQILPDDNTLQLSSIFKWFRTDFRGREGIIEFVLSHHSGGAERLWLSKERKNVSLRYKPYDWGLNGRV